MALHVTNDGRRWKKRGSMVVGREGVKRKCSTKVVCFEEESETKFEILTIIIF